VPRRPHGGEESGPVRGRPNASSVRAAQDVVEGAAQAGRAGGTRPAGQPDHFTTRTTGEPGGVPDGPSTLIRPGQKGEGRRSLERENLTATLLAEMGYRVKQNPTAVEVAQARRVTGDDGDPNLNPDYLVEGRVFDCYAPGHLTSVRNVWTEVKKKVLRRQTQRVVVNLQDWGGDLSALRTQFDDWPVEALKEVKVVLPDGGIIQFIPNTRE